MKRRSHPAETRDGSDLRRAAALGTPTAVRARRSLASAHRIYERGRLRIDFDAYDVCVDEQEVRLFLREFELLSFFVRFPKRVFSREELLDLVWGRAGGIDPRTVDVHVRRLRARIERDDAHPELILTVRGVGYKFDDRPLTAGTAHGAAHRPLGS